MSNLFFTDDTPVFTITREGEQGLNFIQRFYDGFMQRLKEKSYPPHTIATFTIYCATPRILENLKAHFVKQGGFLPKLTLLQHAHTTPLGHTQITPTQRTLLLAQLVKTFLEKTPHLRASTSVFSFTNSLIELLDTFYNSAIPIENIEENLKNTQVPYYEEIYQFLEIIIKNWPVILQENGLIEGQVSLFQTLQSDPAAFFPEGHKPVIALGYVPQHHLERLFLKHVFKRKNSAIIFPGVDPFMDDSTWDHLTPDHNQSMLQRVLEVMGYDRSDIQHWVLPESDASSPRLHFISQAFYPPPVTDSWYRRKDILKEIIPTATASMTLIEAETIQDEAMAIAIRLREVLKTSDRTAAVVTTDYSLSRHIQMIMARWNVIVDDAAGRPLSLTPPGILSELILNITTKSFDLSTVFSLLQHPLCLLGEDKNRAEYLKKISSLEDEFRTSDTMAIPPTTWEDFCATDHVICQSLQDAFAPFLALMQKNDTSLKDYVLAHYAVLQTIGHTVFEKEAGGAMQKFFETAVQDSELYQTLTPSEYSALYSILIQQEHVRTPQIGHPRLTILNPQEVVAHQADVLIFASLNEDTFPKMPEVGVWLSRTMRYELKLPALEEQIGASAFSFYCALFNSEIILTRAGRQGDAQTVPSRWLLRIISLVQGVAPDSLRQMRERGRKYLTQAQLLEEYSHDCQDLKPCKRPYPKPPVSARSHTLSATQVEKLIRNPYALYARKILELHPLPDFQNSISHRFIGTFIHKILEDTFSDLLGQNWNVAEQHFKTLFDKYAQSTLIKLHKYPLDNLFLQKKVQDARDWIHATEADRQSQGIPKALEHKGQISLNTQLGVIPLTAEADRIDLTAHQQAIVYDYKTGSNLPSVKDMEHYNKQLLIEAAIVMRGGFAPVIPKAIVEQMTYIQLGKPDSSKEAKRTFSPEQIDEDIENLIKLINAYADPDQGYGAHMRPVETSYVDDYDHLARVGEWSYSV